MKYITYYNKFNPEIYDIEKEYKNEYNTRNYSEEDLRVFVAQWNWHDEEKGYRYYIVEED